MSAGQRVRRAVAAASLAVAAAVTLIGATIGPAAAARQHLNGASQVGWQLDNAAPGAIWNVDQIIQLPKTARSSYWALQWSFAGSGDVGYMGIQTDAPARSDGSRGQMALFSLWNADNSRDAVGRCGRFDGEGSGLSCRMNWTIRTGAYYRLRVLRGEADATGQWWQGWIHSDYRGADYHLGDIHVPGAGHTQIDPASVGNFLEYFGSAVACDHVPKAMGVFTQPAFDDRNGVYDYHSHYREGSYAHGSCTRGYFVRLHGPYVGVELVNGGRA